MATSWFIEKNGKFYGPFEAQKVLAYHQAGKISDETPVADNREGLDAQPFRERQARLNASEPEVKKVALKATPKATARPEPMPRQQKPQARKATIKPEGVSAIRKGNRKKRRNFLAIMAILLFGVVGGAYYAVVHLQGSETFEKVRQKILEEGAPLRSQAIKADIPNFNRMVLPAVAKLYLPFNQIALEHRNALIADDAEMGSRHFGHLYNGTVRREIQYLTNGQITYTYVFDESMECVAVAVRGPTFLRLRLDQVEHGDFSSQPVREIDGGPRVIWSTQLQGDVQVEAHWKVDGAGHVLDYVAILPSASAGE